MEAAVAPDTSLADATDMPSEPASNMLPETDMMPRELYAPGAENWLHVDTLGVVILVL